jgi:hypothetical protein
MPYALQKTSGGYYVYNKETGRKYSDQPLPLERAKRQLRALYYFTGEEAKRKK